MSESHHTVDGMRKNLSRLASGTILSQILLVASTPLLTRIFRPDAFGILAVFSSSYAIAVPFMTLKYDTALILPKSNGSAIRITNLVLVLATAFAVGTGTVIAIVSAFSLFPIQSFIGWLPIALWLGAVYTLTQQWSARRSNYRDYARSQVIGAALNIGACLSLGLALKGRTGILVVGYVFGLTGSLGYMCWNNRKRIPKLPKMSFARLVRRAKVYRQFPVLVLPSTLLVTIGQSGIPLVLATHYPNSEVGQFAVANRLMLVPTAFIGSALTEAFRSEFVKRVRNRKEVGHLFATTFRTLALIGLPLFGVLAISAPFLFALVFGPAYAKSGYVARAVALGVAAQFVGNPFSSVFVALRRTAIGLRVQIVMTTVPLGMLTLAGWMKLPLNTALTIYAVATAISIAAMLLVVVRLCQVTDSALDNKWKAA